MGRGDKRTRRGKIAAGSFGKSRPKNKNIVKSTNESPKEVVIVAEPKDEE